MDKQYSISEASALVAVEPHVLRYWEEELEIDIRRNEMGHRCYLEKDVKILQRVKTLKDKGIQLKAIKEVVHRMYELLDEQEQSAGENRKQADGHGQEAVGGTAASGDARVDKEAVKQADVWDIIRVDCCEPDEERDDDGAEEEGGAGDDDTRAFRHDARRIDVENSRIVDFKMAQFQNLMDKVVSNSIKENLKVITQSVSTSVTGDVVKQMDVLMREKEEQEEARYRKLDATIRELQQARSEAAAAGDYGKRRGLFKKKR